MSSTFQQYDRQNVRVGMIVMSDDGREWTVEGTSRYVASSRERREMGLSVRPIDGGRARVISERRFLHMRDAEDAEPLSQTFDAYIAGGDGAKPFTTPSPMTRAEALEYAGTQLFGVANVHAVYPRPPSRSERADSDEIDIPETAQNHPDYVPPAASGEHYARTDSGELIGPYDSAEECERERIAANAESKPAREIERDSDGRPIGKCPDCGKPITLQRSGWWTHDGLPGDCWRQSMDGPNDPDFEPDDDSQELKSFDADAEADEIMSGREVPASLVIDATSQPTSIERLQDGSTRINATGAALRDWANEPGNSWPCSKLARLDSIDIHLAANGDLLAIVGYDGEDIPADELNAWIASVLRAEVIASARELDPQLGEALDGPGKFERTDAFLAAAMSAIDDAGSADEKCGSVEDNGAAWRVGTFVAVEDSQGFVTVEGFRSVELAEKHAQSFEPNDDDSEPDTPTRDQSCAERIEAHKHGRLADFAALSDLASAYDSARLDEILEDSHTRNLADEMGFGADEIKATAEGGSVDLENLAERARERMSEMPLAVSSKRVFRIDLSTGGPADWLEVVTDGDTPCYEPLSEDGAEHYEIERIIYHFADWFDHAEVELRDADLQTAEAFAREVIAELCG